MSDELVVNDKRLFSKDGQVKEPADTQVDEPVDDSVNEPVNEPVDDSVNEPVDDSVNEPVEARPEPDQAQKEQTQGGSNRVPANFASLLVGLATSAFMHLGEGPDEKGQKTTPDLPAAQQAIDFLAVLQTKTRGNLESEEDSLLSTLLYDLRLKYVQTADRKS